MAPCLPVGGSVRPLLLLKTACPHNCTPSFSALPVACLSGSRGSAPSTHLSPNIGSFTSLASALRGDCGEGSPPPRACLQSGCAQQFGDTARLGAREQAHEGHPVREPPATDLEAEDNQAAAPAPEELRVSVVALAERRQLGRSGQG